ncbi:MAG TPA: C39 family peptidase [Azospirillum sp.]|nr:C39 family peptidase [Azospirillum sp.]
MATRKVLHVFGLALPLLAAAPAMAEPVALRMPDVRQMAEDGAGAAVLQAVLAYHGLDVRQDVLYQRLTARGGSAMDYKQVVRVAVEYGLRVSHLIKMSEQQLREHIDRRVPVIVAVQAWVEGAPPRAITDWARWRDDGHYLVAVGYDDMAFYFEDPAMFGIGSIRRDQMPFRWHDYDKQGNRLEHLGIMIDGPSPGRYDPTKPVPIN